MDESEIDYLLKIVLIGDSGVGKTNLLSRFTKDTFSEDTRNTIGVDFFAHDIIICDKKIKAQFWDTAGQEKYRAISSSYYKNAHGAILVYDITHRESFDNLNNWLEELKEHGEKDIKIIVLGNKCDLDSQRQISKEDGANLSEQQSTFFMETSAKTNVNDCVGQAFQILLQEIVKRLENEKKLVFENQKELISSKNINQRTTEKSNGDRSCC
jgi:Ras-related protein Rab-11A